MGYSDARYRTYKTVKLSAPSQTSAIGATNTVLVRQTFMEAATVTDWNVEVVDGHTSTGSKDFVWLLGKSVAGTGTVTNIGTCTTATAADKTVVDATATSTTFDAGDDITLSVKSETALPVGAMQVNAHVYYVETFA